MGTGDIDSAAALAEYCNGPTGTQWADLRASQGFRDPHHVSALDVSASYDAGTQPGAVFLVNRSQTESVTTDIHWQDGKTVRVDQAWQLAGNDPKEANRWEAPNQLVANARATPTVEAGCAMLTLPPLSFMVLSPRTA